MRPGVHATEEGRGPRGRSAWLLPGWGAACKVAAHTEGNSLPSTFRRMGWVIALSAALVMTNAAAPERVAAQPMMETGEQIDASPKGLIGLGLVGAELGFVVPALAGLDDAWAFVVFPVVGAAGGAIAGHFLIDNNDNEKAAVAMLSVGLALVVPSLVITLASTAYDPEDDEDAIESGVDGEGEDAPPEEEAEPPPEEESARRREMRERASAADRIEDAIGANMPARPRKRGRS